MEVDLSSEDEAKTPNHITSKSKQSSRRFVKTNQVTTTEAKSSIPRLLKSPKKSDKISPEKKKFDYLKRKSKNQEMQSTSTSAKRYDNRVFGYMASTVSRDMKIDKASKEKTPP